MASDLPPMPPGGEILSALVHAVTGERPAPGTITAAPAPVDPFTEPGAIVYEEPDVLTVSTSEALTLGRCKRRYFYEYQMGRRPARVGHEQVWGAALHRGLESYYRGMLDAAGYQVTLDLRLAVRDMLSAALTSGHDGEGRPYAPPADPYARAALSAILRAYVEYWWTDASQYEVVAVELPFRLPVKTARGRLVKGKSCLDCWGSGCVLDPAPDAPGARPAEHCMTCSGSGKIRPQREGRIDLVVRARREVAENITEADPTPGAVWLVEHKSTSWEPGDERYYAGIEVDLQTALYFDAAREMGLEPAGVMYDVIRRPAYDEPKPAPALKKDGTPRAPASSPCEAEGCVAGYRSVGIVNPVAEPCGECKGTGRITKAVRYDNPRFGESPADYEERIYRLATAEETRSSWFGRRELPISDARIKASREIMHSAVDEIRWRERTGHWPQVGDRHVCASPRRAGETRVCPWLDVCGGRVEVGSPEFERLYPLKIKREDGV